MEIGVSPPCVFLATLTMRERLAGVDRHGTADVDDDRGVSRAMAQVFDPLKRLPLLLVHGILHLMGYVTTRVSCHT